MLHLGSAISKNCEGLTRRHVLQAAGIDLLGISLAGSLCSSQVLANEQRGRRENSCIFI